MRELHLVAQVYREDACISWGDDGAWLGRMLLVYPDGHWPITRLIHGRSSPEDAAIDLISHEVIHVLMQEGCFVRCEVLE